MNVKAYDSALDFVPSKAPVASTGFFRSMASWFQSIHEGIVLAGEYKALTNRGMASDEAARKVFDKIGK